MQYRNLFAVFAILFLGSNFFAYADEKGMLSPAIALSDKSALNSFLRGLVEKHEGLKVGTDLEVYLSANEEACSVIFSFVGPQTLHCEFSYLQDRYNGSVQVDFRVESFAIVELLNVDFDGSY